MKRQSEKHWLKCLVGFSSLKVIATGLVFLLHFQLTNLLGAASYGEYAIVIALVTAASALGGLGMDGIVLRNAARYKNRHNSIMFSVIFTKAKQYSTITSLLVGATVFLCTYALQYRSNTNFMLAMTYGMISLPFTAILKVNEASLRGHGHTVSGSMSLMAIPLLNNIGVVISSYLMNLKSSDAMLIYLSATIINTGLAILIASRLNQQKVAAKKNKLKHTAICKHLLSSGIPLMLVTQSLLINSQATLMVVGACLSPEHTGIYALAMRLTVLQLFGIDALNTIMAPRFASAYAQRDQHQLQHLSSISAGMSAIFSSLVFAAFCLFGPLITGVFGEEFTQALPIIVILGIGALVNAATGSVDYLLNMTGAQNTSLRVISTTSFVTILLTVATTQYWGIYGAAMASCSGVILMKTWLSYCVYKRLDVVSFLFFGWNKIPAYNITNQAGILLAEKSAA